MKIRALISISILLFSLQAHAQQRQIQARIIDDSNNRPVSFVTVYSSPSDGLISDDAGFFRFNYSEEQQVDSIYFSCIGYGATSVALSDFRENALDTIFMTPQVFRLDEVQVESKSKKTPKSKKIIKGAIAAIPKNHPDFPFKLKGYFREYVKHNEQYINLFESIIELSDSGINSHDNFSAGMLFKTASPDFRTDPGLMRPYNNIDKFVPYLVAPNISNELVLLRNHDPVRKYNQTTLYQIDRLDSDFIKNHKFYSPQLTYLDDTPYYSISFINRKPIKKGNKKIVAEGTIFISTADAGIKKLSYKVFARDAFGSKKLFDLNLEYKLQEDKYYLNYLSFNNLFMTSNFSIADAHFHSDTIDLTFSQAYDTTALDQEKFRVFWKDRELGIRGMTMVPDSNMVRLKVEGTGDIYSEFPLLERDLIYKDKNIVIDRDAFIFKNLSFEIANMADIHGNPLEPPGYKEYYQYREFFVKENQTENILIVKNLIDKQKPVFETQIFGEMIADTSWINTPLITESFDSRLDSLKNPVFRSGLENLFNMNKRIVNELVYIHSDREMYAPGDTIWFKAYVREKGRLDTSRLSQTLSVKLINEGGRSIDQALYLIENSNAKGQFILDQNLKEGLYYLTVYSSWMQNYGTDQTYIKKLLIRNDRRPQVQMELVLDRSVYYPGDTVRALVHCYDELNRDVDKVRYIYRVEAGNKKNLASGRSRTTEDFQDTLKFVIPDLLEESPNVSILGTYKGQAFDTTYKLPVISDIHVNFFPEGGRAIRGLKTNMAFKAQTFQGDPIFIQGEIMDGKGNQITEFKTEHDGMGSFFITPSREDSLFMHISDPPGFDKLYALPAALDQGWQLSGTATENELFLDVKRKNTAENHALITVMVRGKLFHYKELRLKKNETIRIPLDDIPAGIAVVTIFDNYLNPRAERLFYINPQGEVDIQLESNHKTYMPRDKVTLNINLSSPLSEKLAGSYSLSVVDEQLGYTDFLQEANIRSSLLLSPEIKGKIFNPNYYMDLDKPGARHHLDLLLLTQGWRSYSFVNEYDWKLKPQPRDQEMISGTIYRQPVGKDEESTAGTINVFYGGTSLKIPVNQNGRFAFTPEYDLQYNSGIVISGVSDPPSDYVRLQVDETPFRNKLKSYLKMMADSISSTTNVPLMPYRSIADQFSLGLTYYQWIEEVDIVKKRNTLDMDAYDTVLEDFIVINKRESGPEDIEGAIDLVGILYNMGIPVEYDPINDILIHLAYPRSAITFVVDASIYGTTFSFVENFVPASIEKIFLVKGIETMYYGPNMTEVVVSIKTKRYDPNDDTYDPYLSKYNIPKFEVYKEFYKPLYNTEKKRKSQIPDLRKTIHWDPDLHLEEDGNATVEFYNGDRYTRVKCILEGITHEGVPVYKEFHYNVSLSRD